MVYALEMFFDSASERRIASFYDRFQAEKISTYLLDVGSRPHITLFCCKDIDAEDCNRKLRAFCKETERFSVTLSSIGIFTKPKPCVYLAPVVTQSLLKMHRQVLDLYARCDFGGFEYYLEDQWVPHCAMDISPDIEVVCKSAGLLMRGYAPMAATVCELGWVEITKPVKRLESFALRHLE